MTRILAPDNYTLHLEVMLFPIPIITWFSINYKVILSAIIPKSGINLPFPTSITPNITHQKLVFCNILYFMLCFSQDAKAFKYFTSYVCSVYQANSYLLATNFCPGLYQTFISYIFLILLFLPIFEGRL